MIAAAMLHGQYGIWDELIPSAIVLLVIAGFLYFNFRMAYKSADSATEQANPTT